MRSGRNLACLLIGGWFAASPVHAVNVDLGDLCAQYGLGCDHSGPPQAPAAPQDPAPKPSPVPADPTPTLRFNVDDTTVRLGNNVVLDWSTRDATECKATGGWSGSKPPEGREILGPLTEDTTYTLTCKGSGGSAISTLQVRVTGTIALSWSPPARNRDGTPLTDLAGYRIHWGRSSRVYQRALLIGDPDATEHTLILPVGTYYLAMTAHNRAKRTSAFSNEVVKTTR